jgi:hypothetical protein
VKFESVHPVLVLFTQLHRAELTRLSLVATSDLDVLNQMVKELFDCEPLWIQQSLLPRFLGLPDHRQQIVDSHLLLVLRVFPVKAGKHECTRPFKVLVVNIILR